MSGGVSPRRARVRCNRNWICHQNAKKIKQNLGDKIFNEYFKFCVIRNPYDKMVSKFFWQNQNSEKIRNLSKTELFIEFKKYVKRTDQFNFPIHSINGNCICDYHIRFENLEEDIRTICEKLNIKDYDINQLPKHKSYTRPEGNYRQYYDDETRQIVFERHRKEFELYNYEF